MSRLRHLLWAVPQSSLTFSRSGLRPADCSIPNIVTYSREDQTTQTQEEAAVKKNSVAHFEIYANDPDGLGRFYSTLFDWSIESVPGMDYGWIRTVETDAKGAPIQA